MCSEHDNYSPPDMQFLHVGLTVPELWEPLTYAVAP
jgi:hypothetical protein